MPLHLILHANHPVCLNHQLGWEIAPPLVTQEVCTHELICTVNTPPTRSKIASVLEDDMAAESYTTLQQDLELLKSSSEVESLDQSSEDKKSVVNRHTSDDYKKRELYDRWVETESVSLEYILELNAVTE